MLQVSVFFHGYVGFEVAFRCCVVLDVCVGSEVCATYDWTITQCTKSTWNPQPFCTLVFSPSDFGCEMAFNRPFFKWKSLSLDTKDICIVYFEPACKTHIK